VAEKALAQLQAVASRLPGHGGARLGEGQSAVVLGAGPVALLGAMALLVEGYAVTVWSRSPAPNPKAELVVRLGATYLSSQEVSVEELRARTGGVDVVYEAAGAAGAAFELLPVLGPNGVFVFTGVAAPSPPQAVDVSGLNRALVLGNQVVLGTVNAGYDDYASAISHLADFRARWGTAVDDVVTARHPVAGAPALLAGRSAGIKDVLAVGT